MSFMYTTQFSSPGLSLQFTGQWSPQWLSPRRYLVLYRYVKTGNWNLFPLESVVRQLAKNRSVEHPVIQYLAAHIEVSISFELDRSFGFDNRYNSNYFLVDICTLSGRQSAMILWRFMAICLSCGTPFLSRCRSNGRRFGLSGTSSQLTALPGSRLNSDDVCDSLFHVLPFFPSEGRLSIGSIMKSPDIA